MDIIAIAVTQGHVQRAIEFYNKAGKYFIIGGTTPWDTEATPPSPSVSEYKLTDVVGLKRVDNCHLVVPDENGTISYRTQNWRVVSPPFRATVAEAIGEGSTTIRVSSLSGFTVGGKVRVASTYEAVITTVHTTSNQITLSIPSPALIAVGSIVEGGALVEGAKYVYLDCYLSYDEFPLVTYRQIGLCSEVTPNSVDIMRSAAYSSTGQDEYTSLGVLEILDNRAPSTRDIDQRELLSIICEY